MKNILKLIPCITTLAIMILIFMFSSENANESTQSSVGFAQFISNILGSLFNSAYAVSTIKITQHFIRKLAHFCIYAALGFSAFGMFWWTFNKKRTSISLLYSTIFSFVYACSDEIHQTFSPGRSTSFFDVILDTSGALFGAAILVFIIATYKHFKRKKVTK